MVLKIQLQVFVNASNRQKVIRVFSQARDLASARRRTGLRITRASHRTPLPMAVVMVPVSVPPRMWEDMISIGVAASAGRRHAIGRDKSMPPGAVLLRRPRLSGGGDERSTEKNRGQKAFFQQESHPFFRQVESLRGVRRSSARAGSHARIIIQRLKR